MDRFENSNSKMIVLLNIFYLVHSVQYSSLTLTSDTLIPPNPGINISSLSDESALNRSHVNNSEFVTIPTMEEYNNDTYIWERVNCPHLQTNLTEWSLQFSNQSFGNITIENGEKIIITAESLPINHTFNLITIESGGTLIFDDANITLNVSEILVLGSNNSNYTEKGQLLIGSDSCRLYAKIDITFFGDPSTSSTNNSDSTKPSKGLVVDNGIVDIHGKEYKPTWTRLAITVQNGSDIIYLQQCVNWEIGQEIVLITTSYYDCSNETYLRDFCKTKAIHQHHQNEIFQIIGIHSCNIIKINETAKYQHFASSEYQGEVALITRRINLIGERNINSTENGFGGHCMVKHQFAEGRFSGIRAEFMGQLNYVGRYPFHFHYLGNGQNAEQSYFRDCAVTNSQFRCFTIHRTNSTLVTNNVAYNVYGHCFYLEDGVEENVQVLFNLAAHVHPIKTAAAGATSQAGQTFAQATDLLNPADTSASGYYILNAYNNFTGNAASGGWSGFAFTNTPLPITGHNTAPTEDYGNNNPLYRPNLVFDGNTAHSSGFYWGLGGSCFYTGGWLEYDDGWQYDSGRYSRETYKTNTSEEEWMTFTNTKAFLCSNGINHWGARMIINYYEVSDMLLGAQLFGEGAIYKAVMTPRTNNENGWSQHTNKKQRKGFEFYATGAKNILTEIKFKNFLSTGNPGTVNGLSDVAISTADSSDKFSPQGINGLKNIYFENCDEAAKLGTYHCGVNCGEYHVTKGHNFYNIYDYDGLFIGTNRSTLIGSSSNWWDFGQDCYFKTSFNVWYCDWLTSRQIVFIDPYIEGFNDDCYQDLANEFNPEWCNYTDTGTFNESAKTRDDDYGDCSCADNNVFTAYSTGYISQWGLNNSDKRANLSGWPGISGIGNTGWYWSTIFGAPQSFTIGEYFGVQIERGYFILLAMKYPLNTQFNVTIQYRANQSAMGNNTLPSSNSLNAIMVNEELINNETEIECDSDPYNTNKIWWSLCDLSTVGGVGPSWYFDNNTGYFYLRIVNILCYTVSGAYTNIEYCREGYFENNNVKIWDQEGKWNYLVETKCDNCNISRVYNGNTFYEIDDDSPPPNEFVTSWGITDSPTTSPEPTTEANTEPSAPTIEPSEPTTEPSAPTETTEPSSLATEPSAPTTEPSTPTTEPSAPNTEPSTTNIEPSAPTPEPSTTPEPTVKCITDTDECATLGSPTENTVNSPTPSPTKTSDAHILFDRSMLSFVSFCIIALYGILS